MSNEDLMKATSEAVKQFRQTHYRAIRRKQRIRELLEASGVFEESRIILDKNQLIELCDLLMESRDETDN